MTAPRPFRFGVKLRHTDDGPSWAAQARRIESLGYATLTVPDHFGTQFAPLVAATAAACATSRLRIATSVLGNDFRHPALLAKEAATLDVLSGGRLELGLGAGWARSDYESTGIAFDPPGVRVERLAEAICLLRACFAGGRATFEGRHYRVRDLDASPRPVQRPGPPILIGGGGRRILTLAAREADIVGINPVARSGRQDPDMDRDATDAATDRKVGWIRAAAGARLETLELCMQSLCISITGDRAVADRALTRRFPDLPIDEARRVPSAWTGSIDAVCDRLESHRERWGISYWIVPLDAVEILAPIIDRLSGR